MKQNVCGCVGGCVCVRVCVCGGGGFGESEKDGSQSVSELA